VLLPWFLPEITPPVAAAGVRRYDLAIDDGPGHVRGVVEGQQMSLALHSRWMDASIETILATGGAAANREILRVMADVFGAEVFQLEVGNSACLGAALRARQADALAEGHPVAWDEVVRDVTAPIGASRLQPDPSRHAMYRELTRVYAACEAHALGRGPDPAPLIADFRARSWSS
jgi:xylulokinase